MTGAQEGDMYIAMQYLASADVGWLSVEDIEIPQAPAAIPHLPAVISHPPAEIAHQSPHPPAIFAPEWNGKEQKGKEQKKEPDERDAGFDLFWEAWPPHKRKADRKSCLARWRAGDLSKQAVAIMASLDAWKVSDDWAKSGGDYIQAPLAWLNQEKWQAAHPRPAGTVAQPPPPRASSW
jgi:hypothetical protein